MKSFRHILPLLLVLGGLLLPGSCLANLASQEASLGTLSGLPEYSLDGQHAGEFYRVLLLVQMEAQVQADASSEPTSFWVTLDLPASAASVFESWREIRARGTDLRVYEFSGTDPPSSAGTAPSSPGANEKKRVRDLGSEPENRIRASRLLEPGFALDRVGSGDRPALDLRGSSAGTRVWFVSFIDGPNRYRWLRNNPLKYVDPTGQVPFIAAAAAVGAGLFVGYNAPPERGLGDYLTDPSSLPDIAGDALEGGLLAAEVAAAAAPAVAVYGPSRLAPAALGAIYPTAVCSANRSRSRSSPKQSTPNLRSAGAKTHPYVDAAQGGRHKGKLKEWRSLPVGKVEKAARNLWKRVAEHEGYLVDPTLKAPDWDSFDPRYQEGLIRYWKKEITNYSQQAQIADYYSDLMRGR